MPGIISFTAVLLSGLLAQSHLVAAVGRACDSESRPYSTWMTDSVIARRDAILDSSTEDDVSIVFKIALFESTVIRLKEYYDADSCGQEDWHSYLLEGAESLLPRVVNVTADINAPLDVFATGDALYHQYDRNSNETYKQVLDTLHDALNDRTRNSEDGFWYYNAYPNLSFLDGSFPLSSFSSLWKTYFSPTNTSIADDLMNNLDLFKDHCHDDSSGLLFHGYDASKSAWWADPTTGASPYVWDRALGWWHMALVDLLERSDRNNILNETQRDDVYTKYWNLANTIINDADNSTGCWWQVMLHGGEKGNYIESSGSSMFVYSLLKGARLGYLSGSTPNGVGYTDAADKCYNYLVDNFIKEESDGTLGMDQTVSVCGLTNPTYEYYTSQPIDYNSVYGTAPFILASWEHEMFTTGYYT
ncbi:cell wall glycosyl hydrolase YteR [Aspergillus sclerotioniger CBS 115572]|uniref:Cell wall glycosyl hydrolase YteR n=1 Tax=Aspergillus sclerotioniger CBS 115572 TaxID=1450535 RepID=A0A317X9B1_9EURO|nr:cell wall glycosyl hydrolase YteR [Aspergillus sclerotioniger CBS 115572]PWY94197.1 cell wall glycosyl hydrolase YteR [Aspergillus sclerotioniger CBS 115572]